MKNPSLPPLPPTAPHRDYLAELQSLNEPMKRRVLIAASAVVMALVVFVWVGYFNNIVMSNQSGLADQSAIAQSGTVAPAAAAAPVAPATPTSVADLSNAPSFWQTLGGGIASMYHGIISGLKEPRQYDIVPAPNQGIPTVQSVVTQ